MSSEEVSDSKKLYDIHEIVDFMLILGSFLGVCGTYWDIQHHVDLGRDTFWIPPHLMVYGGVLLVFLGTLFGLWNAKKLNNIKLSKKLTIALYIILAGVLAQFISAPIDDLWHRMFGLDVTVWSPPHMLLLFAGWTSAIGLIYFQRLYMHIAKLDLAKKLTPDEFKLEIMISILLVAINIFVAEYEYFRHMPEWFAYAHVHISWIYLFLVSTQFVFMLTLAKVLVKNKWAATRIALFYYIIRFIITLVLSGNSWPILPPMVIFAAICIDLVYSDDTNHLIASSALFVLVFYATQTIYFSFLGITEYIPRNIVAPLFAMIVGILAAILARKLGRNMLKHVNEEITHT